MFYNKTGWITDALMHTIFYCLITVKVHFVLHTGNSVSEELELILPEDVIKGSARASVSVLGMT